MINELKKRVEQLMVRVEFSLEEAINEDELSFFIRAMGKKWAYMGKKWAYMDVLEIIKELENETPRED